jgi:hypothetical protein
MEDRVTQKMFTDEQKLKALETIIEDEREVARALGHRNDDEETLILKAICADIRSKSPAAINKTLDALAFQVNSATNSKARIGHVDVGHLQAVAECVIAHWEVIRLALENIKQEAAS